MKIDVVIPVAPKDSRKLAACVQNIIDHSLTPIHKIYIVSESDAALIGLPDKTSVDHVKDEEFPFTKEAIEKIFTQKNCAYSHGSWYYQQLLKFYTHQVIPRLLPNALILDADYSFIKNVNFLTEDGKIILSSGYPFKWLLNTEKYPESVTHIHADFAKKLLPGWSPANFFSGMQHHMIFHKDVIHEIFSLAETTHKMEFWRAFIENVDVNKWNAASEYVICYHHMLNQHADNVVTRHLQACDIIYDANETNHALDIATELRENSGFQAVGCHAFLDLRERLKTMDYIPVDLKEKMLSESSLIFKLILDNGILQIESC